MEMASATIQLKMAISHVKRNIVKYRKYLCPICYFLYTHTHTHTIIIFFSTHITHMQRIEEMGEGAATRAAAPNEQCWGLMHCSRAPRQCPGC